MSAYDTKRWMQWVLYTLIWIGFGVAVILGWMVCASRAEADDKFPSFTCKGYQEPRIVCESKQTWPTIPTWHVYYWNTDDVADFDHGILVYLTLPKGKFAKIEMCVSQYSCISAFGGWFNGRAKFHTGEHDEDAP